MEEIYLTPMTNALYHQYYKDFQNDPDLCEHMELFQSYRYDFHRVEGYIRRQKEKNRLVFAVMRRGLPVGEVMLKDIDTERRVCTLRICLQNDRVKGQGIGTTAEQQILDYAKNHLGMKTVFADAILKNTRSQHVLEKVGFQLTAEDHRFKYYQIKL